MEKAKRNLMLAGVFAATVALTSYGYHLVGKYFGISKFENGCQIRNCNIDDAFKAAELYHVLESDAELMVRYKLVDGKRVPTDVYVRGLGVAILDGQRAAFEADQMGNRDGFTSESEIENLVESLIEDISRMPSKGTKYQKPIKDVSVLA